MIKVELNIYTKMNLSMILDEGVSENKLINVMKKEGIDINDVDEVSAFIDKIADLYIEFRNRRDASGAGSSYPINNSRDGNRKVGGYKVHA